MLDFVIRLDFLFISPSLLSVPVVEYLGFELALRRQRLVEAMFPQQKQDPTHRQIGFKK
jgi:hypothetical protein